MTQEMITPHTMTPPPAVAPLVDDDDYSVSYTQHVQDDDAQDALAWMQQVGDPSGAGMAGQPPAQNLSQSGQTVAAENEPGMFSTFARNVAEIPRGVAQGAIKGVNEAIDLVYELGDKLEEMGPEWMQYGLSFDFRDGKGGYTFPPSVSVYKGKEEREALAKAEGMESGVPQLPNLDAPKTATGNITSAVSQFLTGFVAGGVALKGVKVVGTGARIVKGAAQGAVSDFAFFDGQEKRLSNLVQEYPALQNPINEYLAASPDDGEIEGRFKNAIEGLGLGAMTEGLLMAVKSLRSARAAKAAANEAGPEAVQKAAEEIRVGTAGMKSLGEAETPLLTLSASGVDEAGAALRGPRSAETDALERAGFAVDRDVAEAPIALDNKRRYGIRRETLEAEGEFGERWTKIETRPEDWPEIPATKMLRGPAALAWREIGKTLYGKIFGQRHTVSSSGDTIVLGAQGRRHMLGQGQSPEAIKAIPHLPELIEKAFKTGEYNPKPSQAKKPDRRPATIYHSAAVIDGKPYDVTLVAKRNAAGEQELMFYDMRARNKTTDGSAATRLPSEQGSHGPLRTNPSVSANIDAAAADVNAGNIDTGLAATKVSDFFSDIKDIVDDIKPGELAGGGKADGEPGKLFINFSRIDSPDDVKATLQQSADFYKPSVDAARRGTRTFEEIKLSAEQEDAWKILAERRTGEPLNAEQSLAARNLWASSGQKLSEVARLASEAPTEENLFAFRKMLEVHRAVQNEVVAARTETARALASWRIPSGPSELMRRHIDDVLEGSGGIEASRELAERVAKLSDAGMIDELEALVAKVPARIARESIQEAWVMALLSGPKTHIVNMMSNTTVALQQVFERGVAGTIGRITGDATGVQVGEALSMLHGMIGGAKDGLRLAGKALRMNEAGGWAGKIDLPHEPAISAENWRLAKDSAAGKVVDVLGEAVRLPGRALMAEDEFFKSVGYRMELHAQAYRQATREAAAGKIGKDAVRARMVDILDNPPDNIRIAAIDAATYSTFTNAPGEFAKGYMRFTQKFPALRFITPFVKTPANIFNYAIAERSPFAPLFRSFREDMAAGGARQQLALARVSTGTTLMLTAADLAFNGQITGGGPPNAAQKETLKRTGWQPYSIKVGDRYFSYGRMDPLGMTFGIAADLAEIAMHTDQEDKEVDADEAAIYFAAAIAGNTMSKSYMRGLSDAVEALANPRQRAESWANRFAGSFVPAGVAELARYNDPYMLEINSALDAMKARIPGLSDALPARRDLWGRAVTYRSGLNAFYDAVSPIASRRENPEPIDKEMLRLETYVAAPKRQVTFDGITVDLTRFDGAYSRFAQLAGNEIRHPAWGKGCMDFLNDVVSGSNPLAESYRLRSDGQEGGKADFIRSTIYQYREMARKQLLEEFPELRAHVRQKKAAQPGKFGF